MSDHFRCPKCGHELERIITPEMLEPDPDDSLVISLYKQSKLKKFKEADEWYEKLQQKRV